MFLEKSPQIPIIQECEVELDWQTSGCLLGGGQKVQVVSQAGQSWIASRHPIPFDCQGEEVGLL